VKNLVDYSLIHHALHYALLSRCQAVMSNRWDDDVSEDWSIGGNLMLQLWPDEEDTDPKVVPEPVQTELPYGLH
jgi:hypothetical protein